MAPKHNNDYEHHNPSSPPSTTSVDCKLVTCKGESIPSVTMQDKDHTAIMDELVIMVNNNTNKDTKQPPNKSIEVINV